MKIGHSEGQTSIATADAASIQVRGRDLSDNLIGQISFTEFYFLMLTGRNETDSLQRTSGISWTPPWLRLPNMDLRPVSRQAG